MMLSNLGTSLKASILVSAFLAIGYTPNLWAATTSALPVAPEVTPSQATSRAPAPSQSVDSALVLTSEKGLFPTPLVAVGTPDMKQVNELTTALQAYRRGGDPVQTAPLERYLAAHPQSPWRISLWLEIGLAHEHVEDYQAAITDLSHSLSAAGPAIRSGYSPEEADVDQALSELLTLQTGLGHTEAVAALLADPRSSTDSGTLGTSVLSARRALWAMRHTPQYTFICGAVALQQVLIAENVKPSNLAYIGQLRASKAGLSLAALERAADAAGVPMRPIKINAGAAIPVPSVMHWEVGHFVAIIAMQNGRYVVDDPAFGRQYMMSRTILDRNGSGYYLVPSKTMRAPGWRLASAAEASSIVGGGVTKGPKKNEPKPGSCKAGCPHFTIATLTASIEISDNPVGYHPPIGPDVEFQLTYSQQDQSLSAAGLSTAIYGNVGPQWSDTWLTYVVDDPTMPGSNVSLVYAGGGFDNFSGYNPGSGAFASNPDDGSVLTRVSPTEYTRVLSDGTQYVYGQPNNNTSYPRLIFLTKVIDPSKNKLTLAYDSSQRLVSVTDALRQVTTLQYANGSFPLQLTSVTDPFGRKVTIGYDSSGRLNALTDAVGMQSTFKYASSATLPSTFISAMTTPYGTTSFNAMLGTTTNPYPYWVTATDPLGNTERDETENYNTTAYPSFSDANPPTLAPDLHYAVPTLTNNNLIYRNTFFWDKATYGSITDKSTIGSGSENAADYEKAVIYHWLHDTDSFFNTGTDLSSGYIESILYPLERNLNNIPVTSRISYIYPNTGWAWGTDLSFFSSLTTPNIPIEIARVLPNGVTQLTHYDYNALSNPIVIIDPMGRQTDYTYASNNVDVTKVTQVNPGSSGGSDTIGTYTYNGQHEPLTVTDASGKTTTYTYNSAGQVLTVTNPLNQTTSYTYTGRAGSGMGNFLTKITDANGQTKDTYTYDSVGRIATRTDSQGYTLAYSYDNLDRLTKITYPDATTTQYKYTNLDITKVTDRLGRVTTYAYDANENLISVTDPLGRVVKYGYDPDGRLISLTDADGQTTKWTRDIEGRVTKKTYADGTSATPSASFAWDSAYPRINSMTDGTGKTKWTYVAAGEDGALQLSSETGPIGAPAKYVDNYDELGRPEQLLVNGVIQDTTTSDSINRDVSDVTPLGQFNTAYLGETGQVSTVTALGQSISGSPGLTSYAYLPNTGDRRLNAITFNAYPASNETITTDDVDRVNSRTDGTGKAESYAYDNADRLTAGTVTAPTAYTESYGLNNADFLSSKSGEPTTANNWSATNTGSVNNIGTLTPSGSTGRVYSYDADGNVLSDGVNNYTWDAENRLLSITNISTGHVSRFTYDGLGRRVAITETSGGTSTTTGYLWCGDTICSAYSTGGATTATYLPWGEVRYAGGTATQYYYAKDHLGTVTSMTSATGTILGTLATDAYGNTLSSSGTLPTFAYAGMFLHQPSGIYLTLNRAYDPFSGRWLSRDPAGEVGGINLYAYVGGDPVNEVDPDGLGAYVPSPGSPTPSMGNDFMGGLLNNLSMGMLGNAPYVNKCSSAYDAGEAAGMAAALATGLEAGLDAAGEAGAGKEFSHWIPNRMGGPRSIWNGNYVSPTEHALSDPYRYNFMPRSWKQNNPLPNPLTQQWNRIPNAYKGGAAGGAYGAAGAASSGGSSCGCS